MVNEKANEYRLFVKEHLEQFKLSLRGRIKTEQSLLEKDNEIWSIGQHYGLATPLLDWTASIAVAQFFCFEKKNANPQEFRSIYFWNAKYWQEVYFCSMGIEHQKEDEEAHLDGKGNRDKLIALGKDIEDRPWEYFNDYGGEDSGGWLPETDANIPRVFVPKYGDNGRMVNQRGVFSAWDSVHSMEYLAEKIYENDLWEKDEPYLLKVNIRNEHQREILNELYEYNVNYLNLYPDIEGACKYQNWKFDRQMERLYS